MTEYRLLYFRESRLERWDVVDAPDHIAAVKDVSGQSSDLKIEVWRDDKRFAVIRPAKNRSPPPPRRAERSRSPRGRSTSTPDARSIRAPALRLAPRLLGGDQSDELAADRAGDVVEAGDSDQRLTAVDPALYRPARSSPGSPAARAAAAAGRQAAPPLAAARARSRMRTPSSSMQTERDRQASQRSWVFHDTPPSPPAGVAVRARRRAAARRRSPGWRGRDRRRRA